MLEEEMNGQCGIVADGDDRIKRILPKEID